MSTYVSGHAAEKRAADYLKRRGYKIVDINWRTPAAEIDIVTMKNGCMHFVEVKYRRTDKAGSGLDYITPSKLRHMQRAAQLWVSSHNWDGEICLSALSVDGNNNFEFVDTVVS